MDSIKAVLLHNGIVMSFHHRVTQSFTEFNQFEIKRIELRETLCYSVVKLHYCIEINQFCQQVKNRSKIVISKIENK